MTDLPDYATDPNAVLRDTDARWRNGGPPDYSKAREHYAKGLASVVSMSLANGPEEKLGSGPIK